MTFSGARKLPHHPIFSPGPKFSYSEFYFLILSTGALAIIYRNANPNSLILFRVEFGVLWRAPLQVHSALNASYAQNFGVAGSSLVQSYDVPAVQPGDT